MVIVAGHITVEPRHRESSLAGRVLIVVEQARKAVGCLDFAICADLVDPGRVDIFERWESQAALETFRSSGPDTFTATCRSISCRRATARENRAVVCQVVVRYS